MVLWCVERGRERAGREGEGDRAGREGNGERERESERGREREGVREKAGEWAVIKTLFPFWWDFSG